MAPLQAEEPEKVEPKILPPSHSAFGISGAYSTLNVGFEERMGLNRLTHWWWASKHLRNLGARWLKNDTGFEWSSVEPELGRGYRWNEPGWQTDQMLHEAYAAENRLSCVACLSPGERNPMEHREEWQRFVRAAVERYDGDGKDDFANEVIISYWQCVGKPEEWLKTGNDWAAYVEFVKATAAAAREANPQARIMLVTFMENLGRDGQGVSGEGLGRQDVAHILERLVPGTDYHAVDLRHWGPADEWKIPQLDWVRSTLAEKGGAGIEIWSCQNGTWVYKPAEFEAQDIYQQARCLIKRFIYNRANGVKRMMWNDLVDVDNFGGVKPGQLSSGSIGSSMGLISGGGGLANNGAPPESVGEPRPAYWAFQVLAEHTDPTVAEPLGLMPQTVEGKLYAFGYRSRSTGLLEYLMWSESKPQRVMLPTPEMSVEITRLISGPKGELRYREMVRARNGQVSFTVDEDPVLVREMKYYVPVRIPKVMLGHEIE